MALTPEDGTGLANADAYASRDYVDTYLASRGITVWALLTADERDQAIRRATDYMIGRYGQQWAGYRVHSTQALDWPRAGVWSFGFPVDADVVPGVVARACAELAYRGSQGPLLADQGRATVREQVDVISVEYDPNAPRHTVYPQIDAMLSPLLDARGSITREVYRS